MIKLQDLTPDVYYKKSRDFQFIGRLYDVVLNYVKTNTDLIKNLPLSNNIDPKLLELITMTFGFTEKHKYNDKQLIALCKAFMTVIKNKGTRKSIQDACNALANAEGLSDTFEIYKYDEVEELLGAKRYSLIIATPIGFTDTTLLRDLLNYILPAGMTYRIIGNVSFGNYAAITSGVSSIANHYQRKTEEISIVRIDSNADWATNTIETVNNKIVPTAGLIVNSEIVIPKLTNKEENN